MSLSPRAMENLRSPVLMEGGSVLWRGLFSPGELDRLERICDSLSLEQARLTGTGHPPIRSTQVAWLHRDAATEDFYLRIEAIVLRLNADLFHFELSGLAVMQYALYRQEE